MLQQIIAIFIIVFFIFRLIKQKKKKDINNNEFSLWLIFWLLALTAIILIKQIDFITSLYIVMHFRIYLLMSVLYNKI